MYKIQSDSQSFLGHFEDLDNGDFATLKKAKAAIPALRAVGFTSTLRIVDDEGYVVYESESVYDSESEEL